MLHRCCHAALPLLRRTRRAAPAATLAHCNREPSLQSVALRGTAADMLQCLRSSDTLLR
jgi:hypothetical protein